MPSDRWLCPPPTLIWPCGGCHQFVTGRRVKTGRVIVARREFDIVDEFAFVQESPAAPVIETHVVCRQCGTPALEGIVPIEEYRPEEAING
jgi:hypothetical protein